MPTALVVKMLPLVRPEFSGEPPLYDARRLLHTTREQCSETFVPNNICNGGEFEAEDNLTIFCGGDSEWVKRREKVSCACEEEHFFTAAEDGGETFVDDFCSDTCMKSSCEENTTLFARTTYPRWHIADNLAASNAQQDFKQKFFSTTTNSTTKNCFSDSSYAVSSSPTREAQIPLLETLEASSVESLLEDDWQVDEEIVQFRRKIARTNPVKQQQENRRSLQLHFFTDGTGNDQKQRHSWYAPTKSYDTLFEDNEQEVKDSPLHHNLAAQRQQSEVRDSTALLEQTVQNAGGRPKTRISTSSTTIQELQSGPHVANSATATSLGGPSAPRMRRFEQLLKNLVGKKTTTTTQCESTGRLTATQLQIDKSPSEYDLTREKTKRIGGSTSSLNSVKQGLWTVVPLLKRDNTGGSCSSLEKTPSGPKRTTSCANAANLQEHTHGVNMRKCETYLTLAQPQLEPLKPLNRLRNSASIATCSRCSSLLSLAAAGSRYSLNVAGGGFVPIDTTGAMGGGSGNVSDSSCYSSSVQAPSSHRDSIVTIIPCKLCLGEVNRHQLTKIRQCGCSFCTECMKAYVEFEILEGAYEISCPDAMCPMQGIISIQEVSTLVPQSLMEKHHRYRLNREVEKDRNRTWCPKAGCETVCLVDGGASSTSPVPTSRSVTFQLPHSTGGGGATCSALPPPCLVHCPTCREDFCSGCKKAWHPSMTCEENTRRLAADGRDTDNIGILFDSDLIKCCPMCAVPIEKDEGCAQMMCKRCKHVFCWYCLASLDDDFLLRHYDKGPCKNKLGHSRASVVWHRAQVIGIFAGFGILLLVASPLLLLAAPCIVCCKCRICSGAAKLEEQEGAFDDAVRLQR